MKKIFSIFFSAILLNVVGQTPAENLSFFQNKYPFTNIVRLQDDMTINISLDKEEKLNITKTILEKDIILDKKASLYNSNTIQYSDLQSLNYVQAKSLYPDSKKYVENKVTEDLISTKDNLGGSVFFDDTKEKKIIFPKLEQGSQKITEYQLQIKEPRLLGSFYFQSSVPTEKGQVQVITDAGITLGFKTFNTDTFDIKYTKEERKGKTYHTWTATNMPKYKHESSTLSVTYFIPHIILYIESYTTKQGKQNVLSSLDDLHNWYYSLVKDINTKDNSSLKPIVDSLVQNTKTDLEKVKNIYAWVQSHIKYIAFEDGYGGFVPREAVDICEKRYGDCKDMSSIITEMLELANVKADLTWIGTRDIPYTYNEVFTPNVDNHMIASFTDKDGEIYFLDATSSYLPFGIVSEFIQGKQAMINIGEGKYKLANVPITKAENNFIYDSVSIKLKDNLIIGNALYAVTGYPKVEYSYFYPTLTEKEKREYVKDSYVKGNNKFIVNNVSDKDFENKDKPSEISYDFEIASYTNQSDGEVYINLHLDKYLKSGAFEKDRLLPYDAEYKYINKQIVVFEIPEAYSANYIPENDSFKNDEFSFSIKYQKEGNTIKLVSEFIMNTLVIEPTKFAEWNEMIKKLNKNYSEVVIIKKI